MSHNKYFILAKYAYLALSMITRPLSRPKDLLNARFDVYASVVEDVYEDVALLELGRREACTFPAPRICVGAVPLRRAIESAVVVAVPKWRRYALETARLTPLGDVFEDATELYAAFASALARRAPFGLWLRLAYRGQEDAYDLVRALLRRVP